MQCCIECEWNQNLALVRFQIKHNFEIDALNNLFIEAERLIEVVENLIECDVRESMAHVVDWEHDETRLQDAIEFRNDRLK